MADGDLDPRPLTHLQRAYREFQRIHPDPLSPRALAALLRTEITAAYDYVKRLKAHNVIRVVLNCNPRFPEYELVPGTSGPPNDTRGRRRNPKASRPVSQFTDRVNRRVHLIR
jgi:hypothetical protein